MSLHIEKHKLEKTGIDQKRDKKDQNCRYCDAPSWNSNHKRAARDAICHNCKEKSRFPKTCRLEQRKRKEFTELTETANTEDSDIDKSKR